MEIYLITNLLTGKRYVGKTTKVKEARWIRHCHNAYRTKPRPMALPRAIRKYGPANFRIETLAVVDRNDLLNPLERHFIFLFGTQDPSKGYNRTSGGDGSSGQRSLEYRRRLAERSAKMRIYKVCEFCKTTFAILPSESRRKFCSYPCFAKFWIKTKPTIPCRVCSGPFVPTTNTQRTCSRACRDSFNALAGRLLGGRPRSQFEETIVL